jgi:hypothetical protein
VGASGVGDCGRRTFSKAWLLVASACAVLVLTLAPGCGSNHPTCAAGRQLYKNNCLRDTTVEYLRCTEDRGFDLTKQIGGGLGGTFKVVANATLNVAYTKSRNENTPVALQIVKDCMQIAKTSSSATATDQTVAASFEQQADIYIRQLVKQTAKISLSTNSASIGDEVTVEGSNFWANETVDIHVHATLVDQVEADEAGAFSDVITVPSSMLTDFDAVITASGETSAKSARAPLHIAS